MLIGAKIAIGLAWIICVWIPFAILMFAALPYEMKKRLIARLDEWYYREMEKQEEIKKRLQEKEKQFLDEICKKKD